MGRYKRVLFGLSFSAALAGCASQTRPPIAVPVFRSAAPSSAVTTDPKLVDTVAAALNGLDSRTFQAVSMAESGGLVLLVGAVVRPDQRRQLEQKVAAVPGVTGVSDHILVVDSVGLDGYRPDLGKERDLSGKVPLGLALRVVHGVAYLVGVASAAEVGSFKESIADDPAIQWVDSTAVTSR